MRGRRVGDRRSRRWSTGEGGRGCNLRSMSPILEMTEALVAVAVQHCTRPSGYGLLQHPFLIFIFILCFYFPVACKFHGN